MAFLVADTDSAEAGLQLVLRTLMERLGPVGGHAEIHHPTCWDTDALHVRIRWGNYHMQHTLTSQALYNLSMEKSRHPWLMIARNMLDNFTHDLTRRLGVKLESPARGRDRLLGEVEPEEPESAPTEVEEYVLGFRCWHVDVAGNLLPVHSRSNPWKGNAEVKATCNWRKHEAPHPTCHCGFNTYFEPESAMAREPNGVLGVVRARGGIELHPDGFRAEYAQPLALVNLPNRETPKPLGLPVCDSVEEMVEFAENYGIKVPDDLRPDAPTVEEMLFDFAIPPLRAPVNSSDGLWQMMPTSSFREMSIALRRGQMTLEQASKALNDVNRNATRAADAAQAMAYQMQWFTKPQPLGIIKNTGL